MRALKNIISKFDKTTIVIAVVVLIFFVVVCFYFLNFNLKIIKNEGWLHVFQNLSENTDSWGVFGDYIGGVLNPVIAAFALYLIVETYKLQKIELEEARNLLKVSTDAQNAQVKLAALTAVHNLNLTRISQLEREKSSLIEKEAQHQQSTRMEERIRKIQAGNYGKPETYSESKMIQLQDEIKRLKNKNTEIEIKIETFGL